MDKDLSCLNYMSSGFWAYNPVGTRQALSHATGAAERPAIGSPDRRNAAAGTKFRMSELTIAPPERDDVAAKLDGNINQSCADLIGGRTSLRCSRQHVSSWMTQRLAWRFEDRVMVTSCAVTRIARNNSSFRDRSHTRLVRKQSQSFLW